MGSESTFTDYDNGRHYYELQAKPVHSPRIAEAHPSISALTWHREHGYLG